MNISLSTGFLNPRSIEELVEVCQTAEITAVEFWGQDGLFTDVVDYATFADQFRTEGIEIRSVHAPFTTDSAIDESRLADYLARFTAACEAAATVGADRIVIHPLAWHGEVPSTLGLLQDSMPRSFEVWERIIDTAISYGLVPALENIPASGAWPGACHTGVVVRIIEEIQRDSLGVCLDLSHCMAIGESPLKLQKTPDIRIAVIHVSDGIRGMDRHLPLGEGDHDWPELKRHLFYPNPDAALVLEVKSPYLSGLLVRQMRRFLEGD